MTFDQCAAQLRQDGYNHVDQNRWGKIDGKKIIFARVIPLDDGFTIKKG